LVAVLHAGAACAIVTDDQSRRTSVPGERERKLEQLGFPLDRKLSAGAIYKPVVVDGATIYVSGCVPFDGDGNLMSKGKVPSQVSLEDARKAASLCAANVLRLVRQELGSMDRV